MNMFRKASLGMSDCFCPSSPRDWGPRSWLLAMLAGATAFTRTSGENSKASWPTRLRTAPLVAVYMIPPPSAA